MTAMVVGFKKIFYFCTVKTSERHEVAAMMQRFLCQLTFNINICRIEWGRSNRPKAFAQKCLTARNAAFLCLKLLSYE